jgi:hypothetical protein
MNPYIILVAIAACVGSAWLGKDYADGQHAKEEAKKIKMIEEVRQANREFADKVSLDVSAAISKIRVQNRTVNNEVRYEREVHQVLNDVACAAPVSTVRLLNTARSMGSEGQSASGVTTGVPATGQAAGGQTPAVGRPDTSGRRPDISVPRVR